jgi:putative Ca2+/H+ antiporter (TMEM165/GDT1 family)
MDVFLLSLATVAIAEMGDRTQLLSLVLAAQYRKPWQIIAAILLATIANHALAGLVGIWFGRFLSPRILDGSVGATMLAMALWTLVPDTPGEESARNGRSAFLTTLVAFFIAEIGDKTQIATIALAAGTSNLVAVVAGTTSGMMLANVPVVFAGSAFARRLPMRLIHIAASILFAVLGVLFIGRAATGLR